jgi:hypothetical protein
VRIGEVKIAPHRERGDDLAAGLLQRWKCDPRAGRRRKSDLLFEFALRGSPRVFAVGVLALGDRPGAVILARPKRPTRMRRRRRAPDTAAARRSAWASPVRLRPRVPNPSASFPDGRATAAGAAHFAGIRPSRSRYCRRC